MLYGTAQVVYCPFLGSVASKLKPVRRFLYYFCKDALYLLVVYIVDINFIFRM